MAARHREVAMCDRTGEFLAIAEGLARRIATRPGIVGPPRVRTRSDFTQMTAQIGADIYATTQKLDKLAQLAQSRSLFDDPTVEVNELTIIIKQDLSSLNAKLRDVQLAMREYRAQTGARGGGRQAESHTAHVVDALKLQLSTAAKGFQDVLQVRSNNIRVQMDRQKQFEGAGRPAAGAMGGTGAQCGGAGCGGGARGAPAPLFTPPRAPLPDEPAGRIVETVIDIGRLGGAAGAGGAFGAQQAQMQEMLPSNYLESRALAVESVQSTIVELGTIFQQLQSVVAEQQHLVERIDAQVDETVMTVDSTQRQLLRLYQTMSGNRLAMKMLAMVVAFMMTYGAFFA
ncbi:hypothetical protein KFE25_005091 [Diacronema lutheri]|uniref:t-SNARE coiled-coil homology domain-containing protein n=1 Tax=Diacronema lutheri TaxID=2081491 RepID=A0A8J6C0E2_DIALT|nr:hypothetical protein KFE25_005091 [Diacronema lutheri]